MVEKYGGDYGDFQGTAAFCNRRETMYLPSIVLENRLPKTQYAAIHDHQTAVPLLLSNWYLYPQCMEIECSLRDQLAALKFLQSENGLWRTILNDKTSYEEYLDTFKNL